MCLRAEAMAADYQAKYESLLREVLRNFESTINVAQKRAEENMKASEQYCSELKRQLEESEETTATLRGELAATQAELEKMKKKLKRYEQRGEGELGVRTPWKAEESVAIPPPSASPPATAEELFSAMTCLSVRVEEEAMTSSEMRYTCRVDDGKLVEHTFTLTLNTHTWEYTYTPVDCSPKCSTDSNFAHSLCFPDYMLSRFLNNLLTVNYQH